MTEIDLQKATIRLLLVDDQQVFVESLKVFLTNYASEMDVVGIARNGVEAVRMAARYAPHVVLMDIRMPIMDGVEATRRILSHNSSIKILVLSTYDDDEYVHQALKEGASGYLLKDMSPTELIASIRAMQEGVVQISPQVTARLISALEDRSSVTAEDVSGQFEWFKTLTSRERQIFWMLATGIDNSEIARRCGLAEQTVRNHVSIIYSKLDLKSRFEIIQLANNLHFRAQ